MGGTRPPAAVVDELRSIVAANVAGSVELAARLNAVLRKVVTEAPSAPPPDAADLLSRWVDAGLASYAEVNRHTLALLDGLVSVAERALLPVPAAAAAGGPAPAPVHVDARIEGRAGDRVPCPFVVENQYDQPVDVSFRAAPLAAEGHPEVPATAVDFEPPRMRIPARGSAVATAVIGVGAGFVPGATYLTTVKVVGFEGREVGVALTVLDTDEPPVVAKLVPRTRPKPVTRTRAPRRRADGVAR